VDPAKLGEIKEWIELLTKQPLLLVTLAWGIIEIRRFLAVLRTHMLTEEAILREIRDGLVRGLTEHMGKEEVTLSAILDRLRPRGRPPV